MNTTLSVAPHVDLLRCLGVWFEVARKPQSGESSGTRNVVWNFSDASGAAICVSYSRIGDTGRLEESSGHARAIDDTHARLELSFMPEGLDWNPFARQHFWILKIDDDYTTALIGDPARKRLRLLHRHGRMDRSVAEDWLQIARSQGYDTSGMAWPEQSGAINLGWQP